MSGKLFVPVVLGLSLATASALLLYYVLRRDEEEPERQEKRVKSARQNIIEVTVPKTIVPALIGRGGSNIKDIEKKSGASIIFKKFPEREADVCLIRGQAAATQLAETLVHEFINNQPLIEEEKVLVPAWSCGRIIGSGGENINDISHRSGARVKVESSASGDQTGQRLVTFRGTRAQIHTARELVEKSVAQQKCLREIDASRTPRGASAEPSEPGEANKIATHAKSSKRPGSAGGTIEVYVSAVSSPARFWVQFVGAQVAQLDELVEQMTEYYNNKDNREMHAVSQVSVGQVVAAVFRHDGRWYRARVLDLRPNEYSADQQVADVFFVDYGDSEYVATHELCELRADLLRLRFQAMECFLAGVRPAGSEEDVVGVTTDGQRWDKWHPKAIQRFEDLTKVARWKSLVSATCTYKRCASAEGERDKEIPGIKLYDITDEGESDIGAVLVEEGWAVETPLTPRASPRPTAAPSPAPTTPFGDLGASRVLGMVGEGGTERAPSVPREHTPVNRLSSEEPKSASDRSPTPKTSSAFSYPDSERSKPQVNGSHDAFINAERQSRDGRGYSDDKNLLNSERRTTHSSNDNDTSLLNSERRTTHSSNDNDTSLLNSERRTTHSSNDNDTSLLNSERRTTHSSNDNDTSLLNSERRTTHSSKDNNTSLLHSERLTTHASNENVHSPIMEELKANMNRLDSHHDLQAMGHEHGK